MMSRIDDQHRRFLFGEDISIADPVLSQIVNREESIQTNRISLMAASSICPRAVREAQASVFSNIDAEGYPPERMKGLSDSRLTDVDEQLAYYRRYGDTRSNKGTELANIVETLAERRIAEVFSTNSASLTDLDIPADQIHVNLQCPTGSIANNVVLETLLQPGDRILSMSLAHGGHLTHGSEFHKSSTLYQSHFYGVNPETGRLDYDEIYRIASTIRPKLIIAGASSYPWEIDWVQLRHIVDGLSHRAFLLADISHPAGLVAAGLFPNPIGYADFTTFTTYKTFCGPRGAAIMTTNPEIADALNRKIYPGSQGAPIFQQILGIAVAAQIAKTDEYRTLQYDILSNARFLASMLSKAGLEIAFGGTNSHMVLINLRKINHQLKGPVAVRILDNVGIVCNSNVIPGDTVSPLATGLRLGTTLISQMGFSTEDIELVAHIIRDVLVEIKSFSYRGVNRDLPRGRIPAAVIQSNKSRVQSILQAQKSPSLRWQEETHNAGTSDQQGNIDVQSVLEVQAPYKGCVLDLSKQVKVLELSGERDRIATFMEEVVPIQMHDLALDQARPCLILNPDGKVMGEFLVIKESPDSLGRERYLLICDARQSVNISAWLRMLSDGYVEFDTFDLLKKIAGPIIVKDIGASLNSSEDRTRIPYQSYRDYTYFAITGDDVKPKIESFLDVSLNSEPFCVQWLNLGTDRVVILNVIYNDGRQAFEFLAFDKKSAALLRELKEAAGIPVLESSRFSPKTESILQEGLQFAVRYQHEQSISRTKPYFVGRTRLNLQPPNVAKPDFLFPEPGDNEDYRPVMFDWHKEHGAKISTFAGWLMPMWYSGIRTEHVAVRSTAGLFDLSHMGILRLQGTGACRFLDAMFTNYVLSLETGRSQYGFFLKPNGNVLDDCFVYRLSLDEFLLVTNAANTSRIKAWLLAVQTKRFMLDHFHRDIEVHAECDVIDLSLNGHSDFHENLVLFAIQGPHSKHIVKEVVSSDRDIHLLFNLRKGDIRQLSLQGIDAFIARTGYTGEEFGYEIFLHPDRAPILWEALLQRGQKYGLVPVGLAARDSLRVEAGFPLFGAELGGQHCISPIEAGYGAYVKMHKTFFVGRESIIRTSGTTRRHIVRFEVASDFRRPIRNGDIVMDESARTHIGIVTSCTFTDHGQIGLAICDMNVEASIPIKICLQRRSDICLGEAVSVTRFRRHDIDSLQPMATA